MFFFAILKPVRSMEAAMFLTFKGKQPLSTSGPQGSEREGAAWSCGRKLRRRLERSQEAEREPSTAGVAPGAAPEPSEEPLAVGAKVRAAQWNSGGPRYPLGIPADA